MASEGELGSSVKAMKAWFIPNTVPAKFAKHSTGFLSQTGWSQGGRFSHFNDQDFSEAAAVIIEDGGRGISAGWGLEGMDNAGGTTAGCDCDEGAVDERSGVSPFNSSSDGATVYHRGITR